jgi:hypothetical protein
MFRQALFLWSKGRRYDAWHVHSPRRLAAVAALLGSGMEPTAGRDQGFKRGAGGNRQTRRATDPVRPGTFHCLRKADAWQAISRRIADALADKGIPAARIAAIPNAVDIRRFHPERTSHPRAHVSCSLAAWYRKKNCSPCSTHSRRWCVRTRKAQLRIGRGRPARNRIEGTTHAVSESSEASTSPGIAMTSRRLIAMPTSACCPPP